MMAKPTLEALEAQLQRQNETLDALCASLSTVDHVEVETEILEAFTGACVVTQPSTFHFNASLRA